MDVGTRVNPVAVVVWTFAIFLGVAVSRQPSESSVARAHGRQSNRFQHG